MGEKVRPKFVYSTIWKMFVQTIVEDFVFNSFSFIFQIETFHSITFRKVLQLQRNQFTNTSFKQSFRFHLGILKIDNEK